ncbi:MAG: serine protease [Parcubacteria group bacterium]|nr:serine protease [Parcubacteria group bacterium]
MEIEKLTKMQIVLLTLLVSFVTSIATGIVTVTLMDQAPPAITQTLNRVVERTVERVVPDESNQGASVITKETTVIVKEEDLITDSIAKNSKSIVRIKSVAPEGAVGSLVGIGVIVSRSGLVVTDSSVLKGESEYIVETAGGDVFNASVIASDEESTLPIFLSIDTEGEEEIIFSPVALSSASSFKLGQTVLSLTGEQQTDVAIGIISGLITEDVVVDESIQTEATDTPEDEPTQETIKVLSVIKTSIDEKEVITGSPLIDMFGEVIGISTKDSLVGKTELFMPVSTIESAISKIINNQDFIETEDTKIDE